MTTPDPTPKPVFDLTTREGYLAFEAHVEAEEIAHQKRVDAAKALTDDVLGRAMAAAGRAGR